jgi:hypothetical protein
VGHEVQHDDDLSAMNHIGHKPVFVSLHIEDSDQLARTRPHPAVSGRVRPADIIDAVPIRRFNVSDPFGQPCASIAVLSRKLLNNLPPDESHYRILR